MSLNQWLMRMHPILDYRWKFPKKLHHFFCIMHEFHETCQNVPERVALVCVSSPGIQTFQESYNIIIVIFFIMVHYRDSHIAMCSMFAYTGRCSIIKMYSHNACRHACQPDWNPKESGFLFSSRGLSPISAILPITAILPIGWWPSGRRTPL